MAHSSMLLKLIFQCITQLPTLACHPLRTFFQKAGSIQKVWIINSTMKSISRKLENCNLGGGANLDQNIISFVRVVIFKLLIDSISTVLKTCVASFT